LERGHLERVLFKHYIPLIENDTAEFEISENLTSKITQEIAIQNILKTKLA
jgi:hypothetical protein